MELQRSVTAQTLQTPVRNNSAYNTGGFDGGGHRSNSSGGGPAVPADACDQRRSPGRLMSHPEYNKMDGFPHSKKLRDSFQRVFALKSFRLNQLETINAALMGKDCFVLMPTGGGKSLCYQLPAICNKGVTVVVSPLLSLIQDQVSSLVDRDIGAFALTSNQDQAQQDNVYSTLARQVFTAKRTSFLLFVSFRALHFLLISCRGDQCHCQLLGFALC